MAEPTINLGGGNWAGKSDNLLGYYKEGERFYKQDFTFSRSTTGTYTDSDGYIQEMPYNLLQQSNDFDTTWTLSAGVDLTSGQSGYDGTNNAWLLKRNTTGARYVQQSLTRPSGQYSFSVYLKAESTDWSYIWAYDGSTTVNAYFDLNNGVVGNTSGLDSTNVVSVGNDWYRCTITFTQAITSVRIYPAYANGSISTGTDNGIYIQNAQLVKGTSAKTYFPTTTRLNMPRVDYLNNSNGSLILEPQRTNLITYSEDFSEWSTIGSPTLTSNYGQSPDGLNNSTRVQFSSGDRIYISASLSGDISYSVYLKGNGTVRMRDNSGAYSNDVTLTNEWVRYDYTFNASISNVQLQQSSGTSDFEIYGAQVESGSYPTSTINTSGSSVTRNADACSITNVADRIGQTEGTIFLDFVLDSVDGTLDFRFQLYGNNSVNNWVFVGMTNGDIRAYVNDTTNQFDSSFSGVVGTRYKLALAYKENDFAFYANGIQKSVSTSGTIPSLDSVSLGDSVTSANMVVKESVNQAQLYNTRLSNSELATLTTL
jgi:hypothetical protein